jgi:hypothetical protein
MGVQDRCYSSQWLHHRLSRQRNRCDTSFPRAPGQAAHINFEPLKQCVAGRVSNCTGDVQDGIPTEACTAAIQRAVQTN